ncbi:hypothetical protein [Rhizorhabdus wittichii]|uniref:hypothetical protein n=1 Tax=Rhizorhabdus wittichii TaxID=160791 RepID=UPI00031C8077|nr:hypothetical protein [Rhizorhabdus wittichii]
MSIVLDDGTGSILQQEANRAALVSAVATTGTTNATPYGFTTAAQGDALVAAVNSILAALKAQGIMKSS